LSRVERVGTPVANGGNYTIDLTDGVVLVRVWRTPNVDSATGAGFAEETLGHLARLSSDPDVRALLLDLADAPRVTGPKTQGALEGMVACFEAERKAIVVVPGDSNLQVMQLIRIIRAAAPGYGQLAATRAEALGKLGVVNLALSL
jgi:hypothetical protein